MSRRSAESIAVYAGFVALATALLVYYPIHLIDFEELDYGELPIALLDGLVTPSNLPEFQTYSREGSMLFLALPVALTFAAFGPSLFSLKLAGVLLGGLWAVAWYWVARLAYRTLSPAAIGLVLVLPVPLIQISNLSITSIMAHLGTSLWHGLSLLALCVAARTTGPVARRATLASGLACGVGVYCGYSLIPLIPGLLWMVLFLGGRDRIRQWLIGTVPGLTLAAAFLTWAALDGVEKSQTAAPYTLELADRLLVYGAGIFVGAERIFPETSVFSAHAIAYSLLFAAVTAAGLWHARRGTDSAGVDGVGTRVTQSLVLSVLGLVGTLWITRYELVLWAFDGLRYLVPLAAPLTLLFVVAASQLKAPVRWTVIGLLVAFNGAAYVSLLAPFESASYLRLIRGYHGSFFLHASYDRPLLELEVRGPRSDHYSFWMGTADTLDDSLDVAAAGRAASFSSPAGRAEYWRGVGLGRAIQSRCLESASCVPLGTPRELIPHLWEGVGLAYYCGSWRESLVHVPDEARGEFLWGLGRGSFHDCEDWPRDEAFARGAATGVVGFFGLVGRETELRQHLSSRPISLFAAPELRDDVRELYERRRARVWWLGERPRVRR